MTEEEIVEASRTKAVWRDLLSPIPSSSPVFPIYRRYRRFVPLIAIAGLFATALEGVAIGLMVPLLGLLLSNGATPGDTSLFSTMAGWLDPANRITFLVALIVAFIAAKNLVTLANQWLIASIESRIGHRIRASLSGQILDVDYPFMLGEEPHRLINIISGESWRATDAIRHYFGAITGIAAVFAFLAMMTFLNWRLSLAVLAGALIIRQIENILVSRTAHQSQAVTRANSAMTGRTLSIVNAMRLIRLFGQQRQEQNRFEAASETLRRATLRVWITGSTVSPLVELLYTLLFAIILIAAIAMDSSISLPRLAAFLILLQRMQPYLRQLEQARVQFAGSLSGLREVEWLLRRTAARPVQTGDLPPPRMRDGIEFEDVSFHFEGPRGEVPALSNASFRIEAGRTTAIVGPSGAGKSTLINLVCRLIEPTGGRILVDGTPLAGIDPEAWRRQIAIAGQDIELVDGTVSENICYGAGNIDQAAVAKAARQADAAGFIEALPQGYDTAIGTRGLALSGGQRQRIALARAFARDAQILILDEATNAIDGLSEETILSLLAERAPQLTVLVISHRPSTLANCERRIELGHGQVTAA